MKLTIWLVPLLSGKVVSGGKEQLDWDKLKGQLNRVDEYHYSVGGEIVKNWSERPADFFMGIEEKSWKTIIPLLSLENMKGIRPNDFKGSLVACKAFAEYLGNLSNIDYLPPEFRMAVYEFIKGKSFKNPTESPDFDVDIWIDADGGMDEINSIKSNETNLDEENEDYHFSKLNISEVKGGHLEKDFQKISILVEKIPASWIRMDSSLSLMEYLVSVRNSWIGFLNENAFAALMENPNGVCSKITANVLLNLKDQQLEMITPNCMAIVDGLERMDLSRMIPHLQKNIFANYNGPLSEETIRSLTGPHLNAYGSLIDEPILICNCLEVHHVTADAIKLITARCLHGYLSKKIDRGLGLLWKYVPWNILPLFTEEMRTVWANIPPADLVIMPSDIRRFIFLSPYACTAILSLFFTIEMMKDVSGPCLYAILTTSDNYIGLGVFWNYVSIFTMEEFTDDMLKAVSNIIPSDFFYMPAPILQFILSSEKALANLPQPVSSIYIPSNIENFKVKPDNFAMIARVAPNVAGQLLLYMSDLPEDILAYCNGDVIQSLTFAVLDWIDLFGELERKCRKSFNSIFALASKFTEKHLCSNIKSFEEYLSIPWIKENMNHACRLAIGFKVKDAPSILKAPELANGETIPWQEMLELYTSEDWAVITKNDHLATLLGSIQQFWTVVNSERKNVIELIERKALSSISRICVQELADVLQEKPNLVCYLAEDAFSMYRIEELSFSIRYLLPQQIKELSRYASSDTSKYFISGRNFYSEASPINGLTDDLQYLNFEQFKALIESKWVHLPEKLLGKACGWHFDKAVLELYQVFTENDKGQGHYDSCLAKPINGGDRVVREKIFSALSLYKSMEDNGCSLFDNGSSMEILLSIIKDSRVGGCFKTELVSPTLLGSLKLGLVQNPQELRVYLQEEFRKIGMTGSLIKLPFNPEFGFDRTMAIGTLLSQPIIFANPDTTIIGIGKDPKGNNSGDGNLMNTLVNQMLMTIQKELVTTLELQIPSTGSTTFGKAISDRNSIGVNNSDKFVWSISQEMGLLVGLLFGKALQLEIKLPFTLDQKFYDLLNNPSDEMIESYYMASYGENVAKLENRIKFLYDSTTTTSSLPRKVSKSKISRVEEIPFVRLSTEVGVKEEVTLDALLQNNNIEKLGNLKDQKDAKEYFKNLHSLILAEFKGFVKEFIRGLELTLPLVKTFQKIPNAASRPFVQFLPTLLNSRSINDGYKKIAK